MYASKLSVPWINYLSNVIKASSDVVFMGLRPQLTLNYVHVHLKLRRQVVYSTLHRIITTNSSSNQFEPFLELLHHNV